MSNSSQPSPSGWFSPENLLTLFQTLALVAAAFWTIFLFFTIEKGERYLQMALLRSQNLKTELTAELSKLDTQKADVEVAAAARNQLPINHRIEIEHRHSFQGDDEHLFSVAYLYSVLNNGATRKKVTYAVVHWFFAALPTIDKNDAIEIISVRDTEPIQWKPLVATHSANSISNSLSLESISQ